MIFSITFEFFEFKRLTPITPNVVRQIGLGKKFFICALNSFHSDSGSSENYEFFNLNFWFIRLKDVISRNPGWMILRCPSNFLIDYLKYSVCNYIQKKRFSMFHHFFCTTNLAWSFFMSVYGNLIPPFSNISAKFQSNMNYTSLMDLEWSPAIFTMKRKIIYICSKIKDNYLYEMFSKWNEMSVRSNIFIRLFTFWTACTVVLYFWMYHFEQ